MSCRGLSYWMESTTVGIRRVFAVVVAVALMVNAVQAVMGKAFKARLSPDKRGFVSSPTVLVGENGGEYLIPADGLHNPTAQLNLTVNGSLNGV